MSVQRRQNFASQERIDCPAMRSIESAVSSDFDTLFQSWVTGTSQGYVVRGFNIVMTNAIGNAASSLQLQVDPGALMHIAASQSGTEYLVASGTPNQVLNSVTNTNVTGSFTPNSINYVTVDYTRFLDPSTNVQAYFWDPSSNTEYTQVVPAAQIMTFVFNISTITPAPNQLPLVIIETDSSNLVVSVTDARWLFCSLGTGGLSPNPFYNYPWTQGRTLNPITSTSDSLNPFTGGDKSIGSLKELLNAIMSTIKEIKGTTYWFSESSSGTLPNIYQNAALNTLSGGTWVSPTLGTLQLHGGATLTRFGLENQLVLGPFGPPSTGDTGANTVNLIENNTIVGFTASSTFTTNIGDTVTIGSSVCIVTNILQTTAGPLYPNSGLVVEVEPGFYGPYTYIFTVSSANATAGAIYSNNGQNFTVTSTISAGTTLVTTGVNSPLPSGTLTKVSGTGDSTITYSTFTGISATLIHYGFFDLATDQVLYILFPSSDIHITYGYGQDATNPVVPQEVQVSGVSSTTIQVPSGGNYITNPTPGPNGGNILTNGQVYSYNTYSESGGVGTFNGVSPNPVGQVVPGEYVYQLDNNNIGYYHASPSPAVPGTNGSFSLGAERVYWLAYYDGSSNIILREGQLAAGEAINVGDTLSTAILSYIGMPSSTINYPTYSSNIRGVANENLTSRAGALTDAIGDEQEDRSAYFYSAGVVSWNGSSATFYSPIVLDILNTKSGAVTSHTISTTASPLSMASNAGYYVTIDRLASSEDITSTLTLFNGTLPAQTQVTKDIFVLFQNVGGNLIVPLHKQRFVSGESKYIGSDTPFTGLTNTSGTPNQSFSYGTPNATYLSLVDSTTSNGYMNLYLGSLSVAGLTITNSAGTLELNANTQINGNLDVTGTFMVTNLVATGYVQAETSFILGSSPNEITITDTVDGATNRIFRVQGAIESTTTLPSGIDGIYYFGDGGASLSLSSTSEGPDFTFIVANRAFSTAGNLAIGSAADGTGGGQLQYNNTFPGTLQTTFSQIQLGTGSGFDPSGAILKTNGDSLTLSIVKPSGYTNPILVTVPSDMGGVANVVVYGSGSNGDPIDTPQYYAGYATYYTGSAGGDTWFLAFDPTVINMFPLGNVNHTSGLTFSVNAPSSSTANTTTIIWKLIPGYSGFPGYGVPTSYTTVEVLPLGDPANIQSFNFIAVGPRAS